MDHVLLTTVPQTIADAGATHPSLGHNLAFLTNNAVSGSRTP